MSYHIHLPQSEITLRAAIALHDSRIESRQDDDSGNTYITLKSDLSAVVALEVFADLMRSNPDAFGVDGHEINLWWN